MNMKKMKVKLTMQEPMLGMSPASEDIYSQYIASRAPDAMTRDEEIEAFGAADVEERGTTVFPKLADGTPYLYDYQIKGFFKDACGCLNRLTKKESEPGKRSKKKVAANESGKLTAFKKVIDGLIFVSPRMIPLNMPGELTICQRPLRAQTAQGERIALASSEEAPAGTSIEFEIMMLDPDHEAVVREWLDYGALRGLGQWRNSGKGRFTWEEVHE